VKNYKFIAVAVLVAIGLLTTGAAFLLKDLRLDFEFEDYFPKGDQDYAFYNSYRETYGSDNDFVLISLVRNDGIFHAPFLETVDSLANDLDQLEYIEKVISPTQIGYPVNGLFGLTEIKWLHWKEPDRLSRDSALIFESGELVGRLIAENSQSVTLFVNGKSGLSKVKSDQMAEEIDSVLANYSFEEVKIAGRVYGQRHYVQKMQNELFLFTSISVVIIILFLLIAFRSFWGIFFPLLVVGISVVWLLAFMTITGKSMDLMSTLLPTILFVVGMSDVVHIISRYLEELRNNRDQFSALKISFTHIGKATFLTSITTAIGFLTLLTSGISPVRDFGFYTAIGVLFAYFLTFLVLPPVLLLLPVPKRAFVNSEELFWNRILRAIFQFTVHSPKRVVGISILVGLVSFYGISKVEVDNYLLEDLAPDDPVAQNFQFFEENYSGARPFEVALSATDSSSMLTLERIQAIDSIEQIFASQFGIKGFVSLATVTKNLNRAANGGGMDTYRIPENQDEFRKLEGQLAKLNKAGKLKIVMNAAGNESRISAQVKDYGGKKFNEKYVENQNRVNSILQKVNLEMRYTGMAFLIDKNNETLAATLMGGLLIAFGAVAILMGGIFKSVKMVLITLIPNILPLLVVGGFMGFFDIDLKVSTSIIFTIAYGIAVDDTIHYVSKLKMELLKGRSVLYALKRTSISTGKAIVLTSLILISGFFALIFSDFASTFYIGLLVSLTLILAVLADLFLLPALIILFYREGK
jgi:hypothetical protein